MKPVPHSVELPVPKPPTNKMLSESESSDEEVGQANKNMDCDSTFSGACSSNEPHLLTQGDLNDIVHDLKLSKKQAELLGSRLKGWNLLCQDTKVLNLSHHTHTHTTGPNFTLPNTDYAHKTPQVISVKHV